MEDARGFSLSHQRVVLDIDLAGVITATTYLTINPTNPALRTIYLHASPLLQISSVTLSSPAQSDPLLPTPASFALSQPFQPLPTREPPLDLKNHTEIKRKSWAASGEKDEGELAISVSGGWVRVIQGEGDVSLAPIEVKVDYRLALGGDVVEGIVFDRSENQVPHMYLSPTVYDAARIWTPCVDDLWERCTWELEFTVPNEIEDLPVTVVSSGELIEQITHPHSPSKSIFYYLQSTPTSVQHMQFAVGPFEMMTITETPRPIIGFCLPGDMDLLENSTAFLPRAMAFYSAEFGSYPFTDYKVVFVASPRTPCSTSATLTIASTDLLHPPFIIDQAITTRQILSTALIQQWVGINIIQRTVADTWIIHGLALYLQSLWLKHLLGNNEYRFRLKRDIDRCARLDQGDQDPLCVPGRLDAPDISFINLKAPLVLHILDRHLAKTGTSLGLSRVIPRIFMAALTDELQGNMLSTQFFFKTCRKVAGIDLQSFMDQWVFGSGCPHFQLSASFIRKKFVVELNVQQNQPASKSQKRPTQFFEGSLTVRIHEADGAPFEHVIDIKSSRKTFNLPFNTKYKRTRRSGKVASRFNQLQADLEATEEEGQDEGLQDADRGGIFSYPPWDDDEERSRWKVADWTDEQAEQMVNEYGGYEWIRFDPEYEWIASFDFQEKPWYFLSQLQGDRDVAAQLEAIQNMSVQPYPVIASELARTVLVTNFYYRVRMEAAHALINFCTSECDYIGLFLLLKLFQHLYCYPDDSDPLQVKARLKPNDFSDFSDYFVKKAIIGAIASLRDPTTRTSWQSSRQLLLRIVEQNDNTANQFSDSHYLASCTTALGNAFSASDNQESDNVTMRQALEAIDRITTLDRLVPSFRNVLSQACIKTRMKLVLSGHLTNDPRPFLGYTREDNLESLRLTAFDCLLLCRPPGRSLLLLKYIMEVIQHDPSLVIRRHLAQSLTEASLMSLAIGEISGSNPTAGIIDTSEEAAAKEKSGDPHAVIVKALRRDIGRRAELRQAVQDAMISSFTTADPEVRMALIKMAEIMTRAEAEPRPGNLITFTTPITESPQVATPRIRLSMGTPGVKAEQDGYPFPVVPAESEMPLKLKIGGAAAAKKKKPVHKSQSRGLSDEDRAVISSSLKKLLAHNSSWMFRQPVDPVRDSAPDYLTIIKEPMDLSTAQAKLDNGLYTNRDEFAADMRKIVQNCHLYNAPNSPVHQQGTKFSVVFEKLWAQTERVLTKTAARAHAAAQGNFAAPSQKPPAAPMPSPATGPIKLKVKTVSIDTTPTEWVPPMAPPPLPPSRKPSITSFQSPAESKKRKEAARHDSGLDDMLGAEVDAMEKGHSRDAIEELLPPKPKKIKLPMLQRKVSPEKAQQPVMQSPAALSPQPPAAIKIKSNAAPAPPKNTPMPPAAPPPLFPPKPYVQPSPPADLPPTTGNKLSVKNRRAKALVNTLSKDPNAALFLRPVNPIMDGCPTYLEEIKEPMDLGTIARNVDHKKYKIWGSLAHDIELIFKNCRQFNNPGDSVGLGADALEAAYWREWPKTVTPNMLPSEKKDIIGLISRSMKDPISLYFREPVDPVALQIPQYFEIVPKEEARDLSTIRKKIEKGELTTAQQVDADVTLMLDNARLFNGEGPVVEAADTFGRWWDKQKARLE